MDKKIRISIQVGESRYPLWIDPKEEPIFREAARMVNRRLVAYSTKFRSSHLTSEDTMAMAAVDLAVMCQRMNCHVGTPSVEVSLSDIVNGLQQFLGDKPSQDDAAIQKP